MPEIITVPLPADLPTDWEKRQKVSPTGTDVGLTEQHGYNYLMQQVNNAQTAVKELDAYLAEGNAGSEALGLSVVDGKLCITYEEGDDDA